MQTMEMCRATGGRGGAEILQDAAQQACGGDILKKYTEESGELKATAVNCNLFDDGFV